MKLLFYSPQMATYGGMERHICSLAVEAVRAGHTVTLLTTSNSLGAELRSELEAGGVTLDELPVPRGLAGKGQKLLWLLQRVVCLRSEGWDLIYTNGQSALAPVIWLAGRRGVRCIHHHHTAADEGERRSWSVAFWRALRRAPELVGCSRATCDELNQALKRTDARFLPYLTRSPMVAAEVVERTPTDSVRFGFMGRLVEEKGIDALCQLSEDSALSDVIWEVHGAGPTYPPSYFEKWPRVNYRGAYAGAAAQARILLELDALVLFSTHNEGMPLSLIEALSAGLPWIATDRGGTREIAISPDDTLVVPHPANHAMLRDAVRSMADRIRAGHTSRHRQRKVYDEYFVPSLVARQWLDFFARK